MAPFSALLLFALGVSSSLVARTPQQVSDDLSVLNSDFKAATANVNAYKGGFETYRPILDDFQTLYGALGRTDTDVRATTANETAARSLVSYITSTLEPSVSTYVTAFVKKQAAVENSGLGPITRAQADRLRVNATALRNDIVDIVPFDQQTNIFTATNKIVNDLTRFVNAFS